MLVWKKCSTLQYVTVLFHISISLEGKILKGGQPVFFFGFLIWFLILPFAFTFLFRLIFLSQKLKYGVWLGCFIFTKMLFQMTLLFPWVSVLLKVHKKHVIKIGRCLEGAEIGNFYLIILLETVAHMYMECAHCLGSMIQHSTAVIRKNILNGRNVVNDTGERAIALIKKFNKLVREKQ